MGVNIMNFRVLDLETNNFVDASALALSNKGELISLGGVIPEKYEIHRGINFTGVTHHELYEGDAVSVRLVDHFMQTQMEQLIIIHGARYVPTNFDELIIQIVANQDAVPYYWLLFKKEGKFLLDSDIRDTEYLMQVYEHSDASGIRAIPMGDISNVRRYIAHKPFEIVYNCTDPQWIETL